MCNIHCLVRECLSLQVSSCKFLGPLAIIKYLFLSHIFGSFTGSCVWKWQLKLGLLKCEQISNINSKAILHEILKVYMMSLGLGAQILYFYLSWISPICPDIWEQIEKKHKQTKASPPPNKTPKTHDWRSRKYHQSIVLAAHLLFHGGCLNVHPHVSALEISSVWSWCQ